MNSPAEMPLKIRVLIVDLSRRFGGASTRAMTLAHQLGARNAAIAGIEGSPVLKFSKEKGIPVYAVGKYRADPLIPFRLAKVIREGGFNVIDTQNIQSKFWGSFAANLTDAALVSTLNSYYETEHGGSLRGRAYTAIELWTNRRMDRYIVVSDAIKTSLVDAGVSENVIDLIRNAVEIDETTQDGRLNGIRVRFGIPQDAILCVAVGRLVWAKGYDDFIRAFALISKQIDNVYAIIVGDGILYSELQAQIEDADLGNRVFLAGFFEREAVSSVLKASDIYVMSSRTEGIPFALLEAAAVGLPIVATNCGGIPEVITDNENGLLVPAGAPPSLAEAMKKLCLDAPTAKRLGAQARETIRNHYSLPILVSATQSAYLKALAHRKPPPGIRR